MTAPMKKRLPLIGLGLVALAPLVVTVACGGKIAPETSPVAAMDSAPIPLSSAWPLCPRDSAALPLPSSPDPDRLEMCTRFCNHLSECAHCSQASCLPTCVEDGLKTRTCGGVHAAWVRCVVEQTSAKTSCGAVPACDPEYCAYAICGTPPDVPARPECH